MASRLTVSRLCECDICFISAVTNRTELPPGWATLWEYPVTICPLCRENWKKRFGSEPAYVNEGDSIYDW